MKAIYKITNKKNGKSYVGQSNNPEYRWKSHKYRAIQAKDIGKSAIHDALRTVGADNFLFEIIGWFEDYNEKEKYYINLFNTIVPNGYNILKGGQEPPHKYGEEHHNSTYSKKTINRVIDDLLSRKYTQIEIAKRNNTNQQLVTSINRGVSHRRKGVIYPIIKTSKYFCDKKTVDDIRYLLANSKCTCAEIGQYFGFSKPAIVAINAGRNHHLDTITYPIRNFRGQSNSQSVEAILAKRSTVAIDTPLEK